MNIEEFVTQTLAQITNSVNNNKSGGDIIYSVHYDTGVDFDLAVTTVNTSSDANDIVGGLKISVVGASASKKHSENVSSEVTSRVKFNVNLRREQNPKFQEL